jgi:hypothetical protein
MDSVRSTGEESMPTTDGSYAAVVLSQAIKQAHWLINSTFADVSEELANQKPPGNANPLGTAYAHVVHAEDAVVSGLLQGQPPLFSTSFRDRTGVDRIMPIPGFVGGDMEDWFRNAKVAVAPLLAYSAEVFGKTEKFIGGADDAVLTRTIDLSHVGLGEKTAADVFTLLVVEHCDNLCGEISAIKGIFGLKGYPF